jgi:hypothetical protein
MIIKSVSLLPGFSGFDGQFQVTGLTPGVGYSLAVTSVGERGVKSPPTPLMATTPLKTDMISDASKYCFIAVVVLGRIENVLK